MTPAVMVFAGEETLPLEYQPPGKWARRESDGILAYWFDHDNSRVTVGDMGRSTQTWPRKEENKGEG